MPRFVLTLPDDGIAVDDVRNLKDSAKKHIAKEMKVDISEVDVLVQTFQRTRSDANSIVFGTLQAYDTEERTPEVMNERMQAIGHGMLDDNPWLDELAHNAKRTALDLNYQPMVPQAWVGISARPRNAAAA